MQCIYSSTDSEVSQKSPKKDTRVSQCETFTQTRMEKYPGSLSHAPCRKQYILLTLLSSIFSPLSFFLLSRSLILSHFLSTSVLRAARISTYFSRSSQQQGWNIEMMPAFAPNTGVKLSLYLMWHLRTRSCSGLKELVFCLFYELNMMWDHLHMLLKQVHCFSICYLLFT